MNATSPWAVAACDLLANQDLPVVYVKSIQDYQFKIFNTGDSCWLVAQWPQGCRMAFRIAFSPNADLELTGLTETSANITLDIKSVIGKYEVNIVFSEAENPVIRYTTTLTPSASLLIPFWPRDILPLFKSGSEGQPDGKVHASQVGTRSGLIYLSTTRPKTGSVLYLQNLTALADYCQQTETSCGDVVGGNWPELGFALPPTLKGKPLKEGKNVIISDAIVVLDIEVPEKEPAVARQFLSLLAAGYLTLPKPDTHYQPWPEILKKGLSDLTESPGCWSQVDGNHYFNAYVSDYATPPEIMVQLAVLLPLLDYVEWSDDRLDVMKKIKEGLPAFYDEKLGTIVRWHPKMADKMEGEEEQKKPLIMDSWYLHHPLLNLSRLALKGDKVAEKLFLDSLGFATKVAHRFDYDWPVFYKLDTLEVVKPETKPGMGGEKDVPGLYAHVMLQAWELTGEKRYLAEAEKSALKLQGLGFNLFYQANNTAFSAGAMLRLYKATGKEVYKDLSFLCLANIFKNVRLWDCNYGYGKSFPSFFALFPLSDAPYTAVYEEQEVFCAFHDYLQLAEHEDIGRSVRLLLSEYIRYLVDRAVYYYPTMLPKEMLSNEVKVGELDPNLWIALEDMHDGWEQCGQVGQEVYGAGNAFGILPRHYMRVKDESFMIYCDYPLYGFSAEKTKPVKFRLAGDSRLAARLMMVKTSREKLPQFSVSVKGEKDDIKGRPVEDGNMEFTLPGNSEVTISWKN